MLRFVGFSEKEFALLAVGVIGLVEAPYLLARLCNTEVVAGRLAPLSPAFDSHFQILMSGILQSAV